MWKRRRRRSFGSAASTFVGGIATNEITTIWWKQKRKRRKRKRHWNPPLPHPWLWLKKKHKSQIAKKVKSSLIILLWKSILISNGDRYAHFLYSLQFLDDTHYSKISKMPCCLWLWCHIEKDLVLTTLLKRIPRHICDQISTQWSKIWFSRIWLAFFCDQQLLQHSQLVIKNSVLAFSFFFLTNFYTHLRFGEKAIKTIIELTIRIRTARQ